METSNNGIIKGNNVLAVDGRVSGSGFMGIVGVSASTGRGFDTNGNMCSVSTVCLQFGVGAFAGGGGGSNFSISHDQPLFTGKPQSWGFFLNGGKGWVGGTSINFSNDGLSAAKSFKGMGLGVSRGIQFCETYANCRQQVWTSIKKNF